MTDRPVSTNALIACLMALRSENARLERRLRHGGPTDEEAEELGLRATDLGEAIAWVLHEYELRRATDTTLVPGERLLRQSLTN